MNKGQFTRERSLGNQHAKGNPPNKMSFTKGTHHEGKQHVSWRGGVHRMKNDCVYLWTGNQRRARRPRLIYTRWIGNIPKGYVIYHKDGNKHNDAISNLIAISRAELLKRNQARRKNVKI